MSDPTGKWVAQIVPADDPLQAYRHKPVMSHAGPNATYVGRVVLELWADGEIPDDAKMLAISADAVDGRHTKLLDRIAEALSRKMQQGNPFVPSE